MNDILVVILCFLVIGIFFVLFKYNVQKNDILILKEKVHQNEEQKKINLKKEEKIQNLEKLLQFNKAQISEIEDKYADIEAQNISYQNQIVALREELASSCKNESIELNGAYKTIQLLQDRERKLAEKVENQEIEIEKLSKKSTLKEENFIPQFSDQSPLATSQQEKSILVVDDSAVIRTSLKKILLGAGYDVTLANDGLEALEMISNKKFDVIITDLEMPKLDGFGLLLKLNENELSQKIPTVIITSHEEINLNVSKVGNLFGVHKKPWKESDFLRKINFLSSLEK